MEGEEESSMDIVTNKMSNPEDVPMTFGINEPGGKELYQQLTKEFKRKQELADKLSEVFDQNLKRNVKFDKSDPAHLEMFVKQHQKSPVLPDNDPIWDKTGVEKEDDPSLKEYSLSPLDPGMEFMKDAVDLLSFHHLLDFAIQKKEAFLLIQQVIDGLMNVPIYAPALFLLLKQAPWPKVVDAIYVLKNYKVAIVHLTQMPFANNTVGFACSWLRSCIKGKTLTQESLALFVDSLAYFRDKRVWTPSEIVDKNVPEEFEKSLRFVHSPSGSPWRPEGVDFVDMIVEELPQIQSKLSSALRNKTLALFDNQIPDNLGLWTKERDRDFLFLYLDYVVKLLNVYEVTLLRLLNKTCYTLISEEGLINQSVRGIDIKAVPSNIVAQPYDFEKPESVQAFVATIHPAIMTSIDRERDEVFLVRNEVYFGIHPERKSNFNETATLFGTSAQRFMLARYLVFDDGKATPQQNKDYLEAVETSVQALIESRHRQQPTQKLNVKPKPQPTKPKKIENKKKKHKH